MLIGSKSYFPYLFCKKKKKKKRSVGKSPTKFEEMIAQVHAVNLLYFGIIKNASIFVNTNHFLPKRTSFPISTSNPIYLVV